MLTKKKLFRYISHLDDVLMELRDRNRKSDYRILELEEQMKDLRSVHTALVKLVNSAVPNIEQVKVKLSEYTRIESQLKQSGSPLLSNMMVEAMVRIEKEIELIVYPERRPVDGPGS